ncbi:ARM repeat-containing protein [Venustampulla echinocandica]|uniref:ARM repeat-containing protein n=1 Tax=Venustampulla echinocandica TaxID=2656787 RepID=A0A370TVD5_9HELO|nr:ARM repeat-containing protein [Venustampulla echinocandica]RDL39459.1 ARM repeat-containing protein [Venustampulla echinocandica]
MDSHYPLPDAYQHQHKRGKSSVLKTFIHKRTPSAGAALSSTSPTDVFVASPAYNNHPDMPFLPQDHPHHRVLGELQQNQQSQPPPPPRKSKEGKQANRAQDGSFKSLHKKTLSSISLKSLAGKDTDKQSKSKDCKPMKPKKTKSATNLASLLSRPKSSKSLRKRSEEDEARAIKDKENRSPIIPPPAELSRPPIYAQFSSERFAKQPSGGKFLEDEIDLYTPQQYSPGKQRNFYAGPGSQPSLARRDDGSQRPKSTYLPSSFSIQDISRRVSGGSSRRSEEISRKISGEQRPSFERNKPAQAKPEKPANRGQRVLSVFGASRPKVPEAEVEPILEDKNVDREFEAMLDRRNIPEHQRGKMRSLAMSMKKDFVKQDWAEIAAAKNSRPGTNSSDSSADAATGTRDAESKPKRPRSRTFTLSRSSSKDPPSPTKKSRSDTIMSRHTRTKSSESISGGSKSLAITGAAVAQTLIAKAKGQMPDDFVSYLRKVQKPELVEVGRLHKLRLLLRNETVAWTDEFISQGGMEEIVGLLHRTMEVEWREEHEDALLHEALLCVKALATTALALQHLENIQTTLFPALLHLLFDEEKKGPSEFTTRNIITSLLVTYLKSAPPSERTHRSKTLLSYLRDQEPSESQRPVGFVLEMRRERPYRVWCKEVTNVTKEVFWIFLHNLNVVPLPKTSDNDQNDATSSFNANNNFDTSNPDRAYMSKHFPQELPPVPAAPYVGGVEWDATNYLASHLELVNGIIACLPTQAERNMLREQMRISGWEKCMGCTLRLCKEKFYGCVHAGLRCWVSAAAEDGWDTKDVRCGPSVQTQKSPTRKSPKKPVAEFEPPKIDMKLSFGGGENNNRDGAVGVASGWL